MGNITQSLRYPHENDHEYRMRLCRFYGLASFFNPFMMGMATANLKITSLKVRILYFAPAFGIGSMCFGYFITYRCRQNMQEFQDKIDELRARFQELNPG